MVRKLVGAVAIMLCLCVSAVLADEVKGKMTKVDVDAMKVTIAVDGKDMEYTVAKDAKFPEMGKEKKAGTLAGYAKAVEKAKEKGGLPVTVVTEKKDGKDVIVEFKPGMGKKKDKN